MFLKTVYSLLSFLLIGMAFGAGLAGWQIKEFQHGENFDRIVLPWYVLLALFIILMIEIVQLFSMLKAVKREFMQFDPDN
jgi:cytochrome bd-type quinol oxidase subunit 2